MLEINIPAKEIWDETTETFLSLKPVTLYLEHSLLSVSKWESKWKKPFMSREQKTQEEAMDYIRCMTINKNVPNDAYKCLSNKDMESINEYLNDPQTATWFPDDKRKSKSNEQVTSELIYYWMVACQIPFRPAETWPLNRLLTLIKICDVKNEKPKKMSRNSVMKQNSALNAARRSRAHSRG